MAKQLKIEYVPIAELKPHPGKKAVLERGGKRTKLRMPKGEK